MAVFFCIFGKNELLQPFFQRFVFISTRFQHQLPRILLQQAFPLTFWKPHARPEPR